MGELPPDGLVILTLFKISVNPVTPVGTAIVLALVVPITVIGETVLSLMVKTPPLKLTLVGIVSVLLTLMTEFALYVTPVTFVGAVLKSVTGMSEIFPGFVKMFPKKEASVQPSLEYAPTYEAAAAL
ncbi:hypothetical protein SDC9_114762 [bioreactor metagenome]|uniref:Uncharacterized protein n=1 Tax=bioreactor metagenome TaxID=1076179 RepID=A0A645BRH9_9ZZZZ